jgi:hypothetical protein
MSLRRRGVSPLQCGDALEHWDAVSPHVRRITSVVRTPRTSTRATLNAIDATSVTSRALVMRTQAWMGLENSGKAFRAIFHAMGPSPDGKDPYSESCARLSGGRTSFSFPHASRRCARPCDEGRHTHSDARRDHPLDGRVNEADA